MPALYKVGLGCGACYNISRYSESTPGYPEHAVAQAKGLSSEDNVFDSNEASFGEIAPFLTDGLTITHKEVKCDTAPVTVEVLDGSNAFYAKVQVSGATGMKGVQAMDIRIGDQAYQPQRTKGALWASVVAGNDGMVVEFRIAHEGGTNKNLDICFSACRSP